MNKKNINIIQVLYDFVATISFYLGFNGKNINV